VETKSSPTDLVSEADVAAERAVRAVIEAERPRDAILGEEGEDRAGDSGVQWVVDPLDGTVNYLFGIPQWCVSVACEGAARVGFPAEAHAARCDRAQREELRRARLALNDSQCPLRSGVDDLSRSDRRFHLGNHAPHHPDSHFHRGTHAPHRAAQWRRNETSTAFAHGARRHQLMNSLSRGSAP
jgi:hypothetical protein